MFDTTTAATEKSAEVMKLFWPKPRISCIKFKVQGEGEGGKMQKSGGMMPVKMKNRRGKMP